MHRRSRFSIPLVLVIVAACGDDPVAPPEIEEPPAVVDTPFTRYSLVSAGGDHTCAIDVVGGTYCWGLGSSGRLGTGRPDSVAIGPTPVAGSARFFAIEAGAAHVCGVAAGGALHCWGLANFGQVGNRSSEPPAAPFHVREHPFTFIAVAAGGHHTCAIGEDLRAYCWGLNASGQLGINSTIGQGVPARVTGDYRFALISAGNDHTCGVTTTGEAYCWGEGSVGELGTGSTEGRAVPQRVEAGQLFSVVSAGGRHTCGLTPDGQAFCWGEGTSGQLGNSELRNSASPVAVDTNARFTHISAGEEHTCAVAVSGIIHCWGHNNYGRLGRQSLPSAQPTPAPVATDIEFSSVSAGRLHTCAIARNDALYCWGFGGFGQLGTGLVLSRSIPARVAEPDGSG
jgi:alpha-tubulin suppressor-like RCC1 family protein